MDMRIPNACQIIAIVCCLFTKMSHAAPALSDAGNCDKKVADIIFAVDTSSSIWEEDVIREIKFVQSVVEYFPIGKNEIHIGVVTFANDVKTQFNLDELYSKKDIGAALDGVRYENGGTNTGGAIKHAREMMFNSPLNRHRGTVDKVMIVITDGYSMNTTNTSIEASISRSHGIKIFAVGIGRYLDGLELTHIANKPDEQVHKYVFRVDDFEALKTIESALADTTCNAIATSEPVQSDGVQVDGSPDSEDNVKKYCGGKPSDVQFVLDSSSSIDKHNFRKMLSFVTEVADMFDVGPTATRVGVLTYSSKVHPFIALDNNLDKSDLKRHIRNLRYLRGGTQTGHALKYVRERGFSGRVSRQSVAHVVILITDGQSADTKLTKEEARLLHDMGVYIFALGIGELVDKIELKEMASEPKTNFVFEMDDFDALSSIKNVLAIKACMAGDDEIHIQNDQGALTCNPKEKQDVMFVYDAQSIDERKSTLLLENLVDVMSTINSVQVQSGILMHSCENSLDIPLSSYRNERDIMKTTETSQSKGLPVLLRKLRTLGYKRENGGRQDARNIAFVIIDGKLEDDRQTILEAKRLKYGAKTEVYVVAVGDAASHTTTEIASLPTNEHIIEIADFSSMVLMKTKLFEKICSWHV